MNIDYFSLYDSVNTGIFVLKNDYSVIFWNKSLETLSGIKRNNIVGKKILEVFPRLSKDYYKGRIEAIFAGGPPAIFSSQIHKYIIPCEQHDGSFRIQHTSVVGQRLPESNEIFAVFSILDVTDESKQIANFRAMRDKALNEIDERKKVEEKLLELNSSKDKFFSIIGHDLKNPLNALIGYSEILVSDYNELNDSERLEMITSFQSISKNVVALLQNLLQWSRVQTGRIEYYPELIRITGMISDIIDLFAVNATRKNITISHDIEHNLNLFADKNMLDTVIRNLISNAIKFTPKNGSIRVCAERRDSHTYISVKDSGVGMDEGKLEELFQIDKNVSTPGTEREEGTGLGLILSKELVEKNKGTIEVKSRLGEGTEFILTFPNYKFSD